MIQKEVDNLGVGDEVSFLNGCKAGTIYTIFINESTGSLESAFVKIGADRDRRRKKIGTPWGIKLRREHLQLLNIEYKEEIL